MFQWLPGEECPVKQGEGQDGRHQGGKPAVAAADKQAATDQQDQVEDEGQPVPSAPALPFLGEIKRSGENGQAADHGNYDKNRPGPIGETPLQCQAGSAGYDPAEQEIAEMIAGENVGQLTKKPQIGTGIPCRYRIFARQTDGPEAIAGIDQTEDHHRGARTVSFMAGYKEENT